MKKIFRLPSPQAHQIVNKIEKITIQLLDIQKAILELPESERDGVQQVIDESLMEFVTYNELSQTAIEYLNAKAKQWKADLVDCSFCGKDFKVDMNEKSDLLSPV